MEVCITIFFTRSISHLISLVDIKTSLDDFLNSVKSSILGGFHNVKATGILKVSVSVSVQFKKTKNLLACSTSFLTFGVGGAV